MSAGRRFRSLREIGREIGVADAQLTADAERFAALIPRVEGLRGDRYGPAAAAAFALVARLRGAGLDDDAIAAELGRGPVALAPPTPAVSVGLWAVAGALNRRSERRRRSLRALGDALRALGEAAGRHERRVRDLRGETPPGEDVPEEERR